MFPGFPNIMMGSGAQEPVATHDPYWANVTWLMDGSSKTADVTGLPSISTIGTITETTASPDAYGNTNGAVLDFANDQTLMRASGTNLFTLNSDFTLEAWISLRGEHQDDTFWRMDGTSAYSSFLGTRGNWSTGVNSGQWRLWLQNSAGTNWSTINSRVVFTGLFADSVWRHVAMTRSGSIWRFFVNGSLTDSFTYGTYISEPSNPGLAFGLASGYGFNGKMQDMRYTKGVARYTSAFVPPTEKLPTFGP